MEIRIAGEADVGHLARLLWRFAEHDERLGPEQAFAQQLSRWWDLHRASHVAFLSLLPSGEAVGMAWLAVTPRVPRPGRTARVCGDVQSVYVVPEHRAGGTGTALVRAVLRHASALGLEHVTVHSNQEAAGLYERVGFAASPRLMMWAWPRRSEPAYG